MPTVYVPNKGGHDYSSARAYGRLMFVTEGIINRFNVSNMLRMVESALEGSEEGDWIIPCSLNTLSIVLCSAFACKHGRLNLLLWKDGKYIERTLLLNN